jgi:hypothetical protein
MSFWVYPITHDGSMVLLYMVTWIPSIYPLYDIYIYSIHGSKTGIEPVPSGIRTSLKKAMEKHHVFFLC